MVLLSFFKLILMFLKKSGIEFNLYNKKLHFA